MPKTPDRSAGELDEEGIVFEDVGSDPTVLGGVRYNAGAFRLRDSIGVYDPRTVSVDDKTVKVSANDTTSAFLLAKLAAGTNITLVEQNDGANESLRIDASPTALPSSYVQATADGTATTTSETFQVAVTLNAVGLTAGEYLVSWYIEVSTTVSNKRFETEFRQSATQWGSIQERVTDANFYTAFAGLKHLNLASGNHTFDLRYRAVGTATTVVVRRARIVLWRVS